MNNSPKSYFLAGICGVGMSSLALLLKSRGNFVRGSDIILEGSEIERLKTAGIFVVSEQEGVSTLTNNDILVVSSAIHSDNLVLLAAQKANLIIQHRADVLAEVAAEYYLIAVSGTHGKTTTSGMIGYTLHQLGYNPITYVGGKIMGFSDYFPKEEDKKHLIDGKALMVIETDESDASFLKFHPDITIITNIDKDHLGTYGENFENLINAFKQFAEQYRERGGLVIGYGDDKNVKDIVSPIKQHILYGSEKDNDVLVNYHSENNAAIISLEKENVSFRMDRGDEKTYLNATATALACHSLDVPLPQIFDVLTKFPGMERRMQVLGKYSGITILSDHADHPTEIKATLQAVSVRYPNKRLFLILQPHRYTRVTNCFSGYVAAMEGIKNLVLLDIFPAGETCEDPIALNKSLRDSIQNKLGDSLMQITTAEELFAKFPPILKSNDIVLFMGPGDIGKLAQKFSDTTATLNFKD
jgi:UDP-N-acetylmuramate--alanine ligase